MTGARLLSSGPVEHILTAQILLFIVAPLAALTVAMILVQLIAFTVYAILYAGSPAPVMRTPWSSSAPGSTAWSCAGGRTSGCG